MPWRPLSHSQRLGRVAADKAYDKTARITPELLAAKRARSSGRWQKLRRLVLNTSPLCADPYQIHAKRQEITLALEVDHIVPLVQDLSLAFVTSNLQPLCTACHAKKSAIERGEKKEGLWD